MRLTRMGRTLSASRSRQRTRTLSPCKWTFATLVLMWPTELHSLNHQAQEVRKFPGEARPERPERDHHQAEGWWSGMHSMSPFLLPPFPFLPISCSRDGCRGRGKKHGSIKWIPVQIAGRACDIMGPCWRAQCWLWETPADRHTHLSVRSTGLT